MDYTNKKKKKNLSLLATNLTYLHSKHVFDVKS